MNIGTVWSKFQNLGVREKLAIVVGVLAIPLVALLVLQYTDRSQAISLAKDEQAGIDYIKVGPVSVLQAVQRRRLEAALVASGDASHQAELAQATAALDQTITSFVKFDKANGGYGVSGFITELQSQWAAIKDGRDLGTVEATIGAHNRLVDETILPIIFNAGNKSGLYLDPEVTTLDTILGATQDLLNQTESVSRTAAYTGAVSGRLQSGLSVSNALREQIKAEIQGARATGN